jgi:hypothetical protein
MLTRADLEGMVEVWAERLHLEAWDIKIVWNAPLDSENDFAKIERDYLYAKLHFAGNWSTWERNVANRVVVHELLHLTTRDLDVVMDDLKEPLGTIVHTIVAARYLHEVEGFVDNLATILVELAGEV